MKFRSYEFPIIKAFFHFFFVIFVFGSLLICEVNADDDSIILTGEFTSAKAMKLIYGNFDLQKRTSAWRPCTVCYKTTNYLEKNSIKDRVSDQEFTAKVALLSGFRADGTDNYYMLTATTWDDCHACAPIVGVFLWKKQGSSWHLKTADKCFAMIGSIGTFPEKAYLAQISSNKFGIMIEKTYTSTGTSILEYMLISDWKKGFKVILNGTGSYSYAGDGCDDSLSPPLCNEYSSRIHFSVDPDIATIDYFGTYFSEKSRNNKPKKLDYHFLCKYNAVRGEYIKLKNPKSRCLDDLFFQKNGK